MGTLTVSPAQPGTEPKATTGACAFRVPMKPIESMVHKTSAIKFLDIETRIEIKYEKEYTENEDRKYS